MPSKRCQEDKRCHCIRKNLPPFTAYRQVNLVSNQAGAATITDLDLRNAWGLTRSATSPWWVANNASDTSTLYSTPITLLPPVTKVPLTVSVPAPTGIVNNSNTNLFKLSTGTAASFIFAGEDGTIYGWHAGLPGNVALSAYTGVAGSIFKGLAIATTANGTFLYVTNFGTGNVEILNSNFQLVSTFTDPCILKKTVNGLHFAPFGIQAIDNEIYVTFALRNGKDDVAGPGNGYVDVFDFYGNLLRRFAKGNPLNSPWGISASPGQFGVSFGRFSNAILIGNFGDGVINAFDRETGCWLGALQGVNGQPLTVSKLWAIQFGGGNANSGPLDALFFTAGPDDETNGLFGYITVA